MYDRGQLVSLAREVPGQAVSCPLVQVEVSAGAGRGSAFGFPAWEAGPCRV
jgi:hypothetical protein